MKKKRKVIIKIICFMIVLSMVCGCKSNNENKSTKVEELTVYSLHNNHLISDAISTYQKKHKNVAIKYEIGIEDNSAVTETDAIKTLNTELSSGKGPDVLLLDGLTIKNYEKQGLLDDISDVIENKKESLLSNVVSAYTNKNKEIQALPLTIQIPVITGRDVSEIGDLDSFTKAVEDAGNSNQKDIINVNEPKVLLNMLYYSCVGSWVNKDNSINKNKLKIFLEDAKSIYDNGNNARSQTAINNYNEIIKSMKESNQEESFYSDYLIYNYITQSYYPTFCMYNIYYLSSASNLSVQEAFNKKTGNYNYNTWKGQGDNFFLPSNVIGINSRSHKKEKAKKFISELIFGKVLSTEFMDGLSVNKSLLKDSFHPKDGFGSLKLGDSDDMIELEEPSESSINDLLNKIESLKSVQYKDKVILDNASNEICDYISGKTTSIDDAVKAISNKLEIRLAE